MRLIYRWRLIQIVLLTIPLILLVSCGPTPEASSAPIEETILTTWQTPVTVTHTDGSTLQPQKDETVVIQVGDRIQVGDTGRAMLRYQERLSVELFRGAAVSLEEVRQEPDDRVFMRLFQDGGHIEVNQHQNANMLLRLENSISMLTPLEDGTTLLICQNPAVLTCIAALDGSVEVSAQGDVVTIEAGNATYVLKGEAPEHAVCTRPEEIKALEDRMRGTEKTDPLSTLVDNWSKNGCGEAQQQTNSSNTTGLPSSEGMVMIEGAEYQIGTNIVDDFHVPAQQITLASFWIDTHEVSNAQFRGFLNQNGQAVAEIKPGQEQHPASRVTWDQAAAYCAWVNKRLPSEAEWEVAARGPGSEPPIYPWGDDPTAGGQVDQLPRTDTYAVGTFDFNQSPSGVFDMAGNVWEWVGTPYADIAEGDHLLRGGRFGFIKDMAYRQQVTTGDERFIPYAGFRCAADQVEP